MVYPKAIDGVKVVLYIHIQVVFLGSHDTQFECHIRFFVSLLFPLTNTIMHPALCFERLNPLWLRRGWTCMYTKKKKKKTLVQL